MKLFHVPLRAMGAVLLLVAVVPFLAAAPAVSAPAAQISAKALTDHECDTSEWHFVITQIDQPAHAPLSVAVTWANGAQDTVSLGQGDRQNSSLHDDR